jgi:hypothetical protein
VAMFCQACKTSRMVKANPAYTVLKKWSKAIRLSAS